MPFAADQVRFSIRTQNKPQDGSPKKEGEKEVCLPEGSGKSRHMLNLEGRMEGRVKIEREKLEHFQMEEGKKGWPVVE